MRCGGRAVTTSPPFSIGNGISFGERSMMDNYQFADLCPGTGLDGGEARFDLLGKSQVALLENDVPADFRADLQRFEDAVNEVSGLPDVRGQKRLAIEELVAVPEDRWPEARLVPAACLRLLKLRFSVGDYCCAICSGTTLSAPEPQTTFLALIRRDGVVRWYELPRSEYELLTALRDGETIGGAIDKAAERTDDVETLAGRLEHWFRLWAAEGFFQRVQLA